MAMSFSAMKLYEMICDEINHLTKHIFNSFFLIFNLFKIQLLLNKIKQWLQMSTLF